MIRDARPGVRSDRSRPLALLALFAAIAAGPANAGTLVVWGRAEAVYRVQADFPLPLRPYRGAAFEQEVRRLESGQLQVRVRSLPGSVRLDTPHPLRGGQDAELAPAEPLPQAALDEARRLATMSMSRRQLVEEALDWIVRRVEYRSVSGQSQAPAEVLERGSANCVGLSRLAVGLLRQAGIPARSVHAFRLQLQEGRVVGGAFHRLLEVHYPGVGWIASDVGRTKNYLPPDLLILAVEGEPLTPQQTLVEAEPAVPYHQRIDCRLHQEELLALDTQHWPEKGTLLSAWTPGHGQSRGAIVGTLVGAPPDVRLSAESARGRIPGATRAGDQFAFPGLLPGSYTIVIDSPRGRFRSGPWRLAERELVQLKLDLSSLGEAGQRR